MSIKNFSTGRLKNDEAYSFHKAVCELAKTVTLEAAAPTVSAYGAAFEKLKSAIDRTPDASTAKVAQDMDAARDFSWRGAKAYLKCMATYALNEGKKEAAGKILSLFEKYGNPVELPLAEETSVVDNLIESVESLDASVIESAAFGEWLSDLKSRQAAYEEAERANLSEKAGKVLGEVKSARAECDTCYSNLVAVVNTFTMIQGGDSFKDFINPLNVMIDQHKAVAKARATKASQKSEEEAQPHA